MDIRNPAADWLARANHLAITASLLPNTVHDVNNALQVISGSAELLDLMAGADEDVRRRGLAIRSHALRATTLLAELVTFTRDADDRSQRLSMRAGVERALALRHYSLTKLGITTTVDGGGDAVGIARYLLQILLNLTINAEQALSGRPGSRITVRIAPGDEQVLVTIADNGPGLSAEVERRLFGPDSHTLAPFGRLGIGLAVSKELAERQGGRLTFAPGTGGGCVFTLALPAPLVHVAPG
jgi:C4-dicarboxylate-specific signal transduction histidine kinase